MRKSNFSEEFKRDAVRQMTERGYQVVGGICGQNVPSSSERLKESGAVVCILMPSARDFSSSSVTWFETFLRKSPFTLAKISLLADDASSPEILRDI